MMFMSMEKKGDFFMAGAEAASLTHSESEMVHKHLQPR